MAITLTTNPQVIGEASDSAFTAQLLGWYSNQSGNTATVHVKMRVKYFHDAYYYGTNKSYSLNFNGTSSAQYPSQMNNGVWYDMAERTESKTGGSTIAASGSWYSYTFGNFSVGLSDTVQLPAFIVPPSTPVLSAVISAHKAIITWGVASYGVPASGAVTLNFRAPGGSWQQLARKTTTGQWTYTLNGLTPWTGNYELVVNADNSQRTSTKTVYFSTGGVTYAPNASDKAKEVQKMLVSLNGLSKYAIKLYRGDANNEAERIY